MTVEEGVEAADAAEVSYQLSGGWERGVLLPVSWRRTLSLSLVDVAGLCRLLLALRTPERKYITVNVCVI